MTPRDRAKAKRDAIEATLGRCADLQLYLL
jgi:hypothetical protein